MKDGIARPKYCAFCGYIEEQCECDKPKTNADRIRSMTDEELAEFLNMVSNDSMDTITGYGTKDYSVTWENQRDTMQWLQTEAE